MHECAFLRPYFGGRVVHNLRGRAQLSPTVTQRTRLLNVASGRGAFRSSYWGQIRLAKTTGEGGGVQVLVTGAEATGSVRMEGRGMPSTETVRAASFMECVDHTVTILGGRNEETAEEGLSEQQAQLLHTMVGTSNGARGVLVSVLSDPRVTVADGDGSSELAERVLLGWSEGSEEQERVRDLLVKNVFMSSSMALLYSRQGDEERREGSELTRERAVRVTREVGKGDAGVRGVGLEMVAGAEEGKGRFVGFLEKWGYDEGQKAEGAKWVRRAVNSEP